MLGRTPGEGGRTPEIRTYETGGQDLWVMDPLSDVGAIGANYRRQTLLRVATVRVRMVGVLTP